MEPMNVTHGFHATMAAQPGKGDAVERLLRDALQTGPAAHEACVVFLIGRSTTNPDVVYVTEGWTSKEAHDRVFASDQARTLVAGFEALLAAEPQYLDEVLVGGKFTAELSPNQ